MHGLLSEGLLTSNCSWACCDIAIEVAGAQPSLDGMAKSTNTIERR